MIYELHEVNKLNITKMSSIIKSDDILVLDDGLFSQFYFLNELMKIDCIKYFAISCDLISEDILQINNINRNKAMWLYKEKRIKYSYMNIDQLKILKETNNCNLCLHGYNHLNFNIYMNKFKDLKFLTNEFIIDFNKSLEWFEKKINYIPDSYCFPYNYTYNNYLESIIKKEYSFIKNVFGPGRISI